MSGDYSLYVAAAYAVCFIMLGIVVFTTLAAWKKVK